MRALHLRDHFTQQRFHRYIAKFEILREQSRALGQHALTARNINDGGRILLLFDRPAQQDMRDGCKHRDQRESNDISDGKRSNRAFGPKQG